MAEQINHPDWYGGGDNPFEVIKVLRGWNLELAKGFCWGSLIKYTQRAGRKGSGAVADRRKAEWYATELVSIEAELAGRAKKGPSEIPITVYGAGSYKLHIDWDKRTTRLESDVLRGSAGSSSGSAGGGAGGAGGAGGGAHWPESVTRTSPDLTYGGGYGGGHPSA